MTQPNCDRASRAEMMKVVAQHREDRGDREGAERARQSAEQIRTSQVSYRVRW